VVDFLTYRETYGGTLPETVFTAQKRGAQDTILALLYPRQPKDLTAVETKAVAMAICAQIDSGLDKPFASEKNGDWRAQYAPGLIRIGGMPVAPGAVGYLRAAGLLESWL